MSEFIKLTGVDPVRGISHRMSVLRSQIYMVSDVDMVAPCKGATVFTFQDDDTAIRTVESYEEIMALLRNDELPSANESLVSANNTLAVALAAKTIEIDDLTGRLSDALQLNCEVGRQLHEALRQRDEATKKCASFKAAYLSVTSG